MSEDKINQDSIEVEEVEVEQNEDKPQKEKAKKKVDKKQQEIDNLKLENSAINDKFLRVVAEYDNYKKRTDKERLSIAEYSKAQMVKLLLPILDNIDRANSTDKANDDYIKGVEMIIKQFTDLITTLNLSELGVVGETFDPNLHEAVMHIEDENLPENSVSQVLQKGYKLGDTVLRAAMVQVAN